MTAQVLFVNICECGVLKKATNKKCIECEIGRLGKIYNIVSRVEFWSRIFIPATALLFIIYMAGNTYLNIKEAIMLNNTQSKLTEKMKVYK